MGSHLSPPILRTARRIGPCQSAHVLTQQGRDVSPQPSGEVDLGKPRWLPKHSAVNVQGLASFDHRKLTRRMGELNATQMAEVKSALRDLLGL